MRFTILGAAGTIGSALAEALEVEGHAVTRVTRDTLRSTLAAGEPAGHVINCIGMTGDFRTRPHATAEAHVTITAACLTALRFDSFLILSSTRLYGRAAATAEATPIPCASGDPSDLYTLTKLTGEALCLVDPRPCVRVVRLSNVYGGLAPDTFLGAVLAEGCKGAAVQIRQAADSEKDYVSLADVVALLPRIAGDGRHRLYNVATGRNVRHDAIAAVLRAQGWSVGFAPNAATHRFPLIDTTRLQGEFAPSLRGLLDDLPTLVASGQEVRCSPSMRPVAV
ncbi:MAG: SDR family oxidoreductase [Rhodospirillales bacterium]|nr:SDR family oxidoreductase [Rhodospirillales bacterium]